MPLRISGPVTGSCLHRQGSSPTELLRCSRRSAASRSESPREPVYEALTHHASPDFWACYRILSASARKLADGAFALLKTIRGIRLFTSRRSADIGLCGLACITAQWVSMPRTACYGFGSETTVNTIISWVDRPLT